METIRGQGMKWVAESVGAKGAAVIVIAIAAAWVYATWDEPGILAEAPDLPLQVVTALKGVQLGQKLAAVVSTHGPFDKEKTPTHTVKKYADEEDYVQRNGQLRLGVREGVVRSLGYPCIEGRDPTVVNNIACHHFEDRIRKVFGDHLRVLCARVSPDHPNKDLAPHVRAYDAIEYGTRYVVIKDVVQGFIVTDPKELESLVGFNWVKCA